MNIVIVTREYSPRKYHGGIGTRFRNLAEWLNTEKNSVHVITQAEEGEEESEYSENSIRIHKIKTGEIKFPGFWRLERLAPTAIRRLKYSWKVNKILQKLMIPNFPNIVVSADWGAETFWFAAFGKTAGTSLVTTLSGPSFLVNQFNCPASGLDQFLQNLMEKILVRKSDKIHSVSHYLAKKVSSEFEISQERINVIHAWVNTDTFSGDGFETAEKFVLFVGRLERLKGVEILAQAIRKVHKELPETRFVFIGKDMPIDKNSASMKMHLENILGESLPRVLFTGHIPQQELSQYYKESIVCIMPSLVESFGNAALEAMACGKPVLATSETGFEEMIHHDRNGILVEPGNAEDLSGQILRLLKNADLRKNLGANAIQTISHQFNRQIKIHEWQQFLTDTFSPYERKPVSKELIPEEVLSGAHA